MELYPTMPARALNQRLFLAIVAICVVTFIGLWMTVITSTGRYMFNPVSYLGIQNHKPRSRIDPHRRRSIPHIIHQTWNTFDIPVELAEWVKSWMTLNPTWEYYLWTPYNAKILIRERYPEYLDTYESYTNTILRTDAMRYFIMHAFGGFYVDLDMECLQPLDEWTFDHQCILSHEPYEHQYLLYEKTNPNVANTIFASRPGHPFFQACIEALPMAAKAFPMDTTRATGSLLVDRVYNGYMHSRAILLPEYNVTVVPPKYFLPTYDPKAAEKIQKQCKVPKYKLVPHAVQMCKDLQSRNFSNKLNPASFTNHHWVHMFHNEQEWQNKHDVYSIFQLIEDTIVYNG